MFLCNGIHQRRWLIGLVSYPCYLGYAIYETKPFFARRCRSPTRTSIFVALEGWRVLPPANMKTAPSFVWFAAIQSIERKQDLARLAPKGCFISAKAIEREVRQIGETQKATRELSGGLTTGLAALGAGPGRASVPLAMPRAAGIRSRPTLSACPSSA